MRRVIEKYKTSFGYADTFSCTIRGLLIRLFEYLYVYLYDYYYYVFSDRVDVNGAYKNVYPHGID